MGTIAYMAPAQLRGDAVGARADIFACGVVLYELATGTLPFAGHGMAENDIGGVDTRAPAGAGIDEPGPIAGNRTGD